MIALERETSLRVEPGTSVEITCLSGVVWVTQEGDSRDLFLARGEWLDLLPRGVALVTALEASTVRVLDRGAQPRAPRTWRDSARRGLALWSRLATRTTAVVKPGAAATE